MEQAALIVVIVFLVALTGIGTWHARRIRSAEDFALAGRRFGVFVLSGTLIATWIGTGSIFGNAEKAYTTGLAVLLFPIAGAAGILILAFLAPRVRKIDALTVPEILGQRFGISTQRLGSVALILAYMIIVSYQYRAGVAVAHRIFPDVDPVLLRFGFATFIILYTALAGMVSVAWTDVANGIVLSIGIVIALAYMLLTGDDAGATQRVAAPEETWYSFGGGLSVVTWIGLLLPAFLLVMGDANIHQRFMSAKSPATARQAAIVMFIGVLILEAAIIGLALLGRLRLPEAPENPGHVIIEMGFTVLPPVIGVMIAATAIAVIVSTADSFLLASATSLASDFVRRKPTPLVQRLLVVTLGLVALGISFLSDEYFNVAIYAYTLYGACLTPAILCALLRPRTPGIAVLGSMAAGLGVAILWKIAAEYGWLLEGWSEIEPVIPALGANLLVLISLAAICRDQDDAASTIE